MTGLLGDLALLVTVAAVVSAAAALLVTRDAAVALPVLLDLLLAASLLRLATRPTVGQLAGTAVLVLVKRVAGSAVRRSAAARRSTTSP
ncbi:MAG: hypothetical protein M3P95_00270 [Actinomycetota bacterium]|nr:hypothetical protein [Actinomycetota bacterium]